MRYVMVKTVLAALAAAGATAACSGPTTTPPPSSAPASISASPASSSTAPTTSAAPKPFPAAADGTNLRACADGDCEILVTGPTTIRFAKSLGMSSLDITAVSPAGVDFQSVSPSGMVMSAREQTPDQGGPSTINKLSFEVIALEGSKAVVRFTHT
ncbi:hypothetical protein ACWEHA_34220 [Amycolatopsis nivea]